jgi:trehalose 6-phosphate phosphatase
VFLDFDGTLSPIVLDPATAEPAEGAVEALHALSRDYATVAVVSGRPVAFLDARLRLGGTGVLAFGLYGLERLVDGRRIVDDEAASWQRAVDQVAAAAEAVAPEGVGVERKGLAVTLHVRPAPEHDAWARAFAESQAAAVGLQLDAGRSSYELRPPLHIDKGTVVGQLVQGLDAAAFVGDDRGDLLAFDALDRFAADGGLAVKIAVRSAEAPAELLERADELVDGPAAVVTLLRELAGDA